MDLNEDQREPMFLGLYREIEGLSEAKTLEERNAIYEAEKKKSFAAFVQQYGCPFGGNSSATVSSIANIPQKLDGYRKVH